VNLAQNILVGRVAEIAEAMPQIEDAIKCLADGAKLASPDLRTKLD